ncbi:Fanconi anemia group A protein [Apus apus]|uniref:Fanconi anemia group A protein n=1 Tax=Apus apus TaxID=8895 RepID=UPI0021F8B125|nr:Fanconi anemia group A protein [Apus apus]
MARYGMVQYGSVRDGTGRDSTVMVQFGTTQCSSVRHGTARYCSARAACEELEAKSRETLRPSEPGAGPSGDALQKGTGATSPCTLSQPGCGGVCPRCAEPPEVRGFSAPGRGKPFLRQPGHGRGQVHLPVSHTCCLQRARPCFRARPRRVPASRSAPPPPPTRSCRRRWREGGRGHARSSQWAGAAGPAPRRQPMAARRAAGLAGAGGMAGAGGRRWRDLLASCGCQRNLNFSAGRARKRKSAFGSGAELREAALRLLDQHQNLTDLLLEVEESAKPDGQGGAELQGVSSASFIVSVLQEQASRLGVPTAALAAKNAVTNIERICRVPASPSQLPLLDLDQRKRLSRLLQTLKDLLANNVFSRSLFCQELWKMKDPPVLEVVWHLHRGDILGLAELLESSPSAAGEWLCHSLRRLCQPHPEACGDLELPGHLLSDLAVVFVQNGFQQTSDLGRKLEFKKVPHICHAVLHRMLTWVLDAVGKEKQEDVSTLQAMRFWLNVFNVSGYRSAVHPDSLQQFFRHTLTEVLTYNPSWKVSDAIRMQKEWSFTRTCSLLTTLYRKLFMAFSAKECVCQLQQVLETREVNWQHVLSCVSTLAVCRAEAEQLFRDLLSHLLMKAFENYDMENLITAFLIARQAALEGPAVFMPYSEWFKASFGNAGGHHGSSKKALVFLFEFLSELVPFEAAPYLKVHIMYPPFVPTKHRPILLEYITLAKTRLADLKVAIEDMGLYEDLSTTDESVQPQAQALRDVEKALQIFENTRKIPTSVIEASIFRRPYYTSWFLPALLRPRVLPRAPDVRMAFIDSLKRADKIPSNLYSTYVQACRAAKEKRLQDECKEESSPSREPVEQLRAELAVLRTLVVDQAKYEDVPAQVAVISHTLGSVCAQDSHEDQTAAATSPIQVNISAPRLEPCQQSVVDLLLTSFCQHLVAASYFNPPNRQGPCLSLFVKMMCGHRNLLPALLGRLCQLIYHQGPSLNDAHILGLAAFVIHLGESRALMPAVEANFGLSQPVPQKVLSVSEFWNLLLTCRTAESFAFCLRFCTAAASYLMCKFSSYSHEDLCALLPPSLVKKLQYLVPRLCLEARGALWEEGPAELLWSSLSCPSRDYRRASLSLWQQARFQQLLKEQAFQLSFREWLLLELEVSPEKDILSASERQDFHYWAIYQRYLPAPSASGGCDGDLQQACGILINTLLDSSQRLELGSRGRWEVSVSPGILCKLQEMVLELGCRQKLLSGSSDAQRHFLFEILQERLRNGEQGSALGQQLWRQQELLLHRRILVGLPASTLIMTCQKGRKTMLDCEDFFNFVNSELKNVCSRGYALSYDITAHFFRGLLHASLGCEEPAEGVSEVLTACQSRCPTLLFSAVLWWPSLEPVLCSQWKRLFGDPLAEELRRLREWQSSAASFLSSGAVFPLSGPPWISAAFLHCAVQQQSRRGQGSRALKRLGTGTEQLLVSLLFFSLLDLISAKIAPKEGVDFQASLEWSLEILQCLEERGTSWPLLFHSAGKEPGHYVVLRSAASARHTRLLPLAFYSLTPCFHHELLAREPTFLHLALDLYVQLLQLFVEGQELPQPDPAGQSPGPAEHEDPLQLISSARRFLLAAIPRCPAQSFANIRPLLATCEELDPELGATLLHFSRPAMAMELDEELVLFD